ncbi:MAG TPA: MAPEG family protein [Stellaceae bacterium]|nr:MAPEG family protein [Stellaceae bacterium]
MGLHIVPLYAALLALLFLALSVRVMAERGRVGVAIGAGGSIALERRIRVHGNFAEYVPLALLLLAFLELRGSAAWYLHLLGLALLIGRLAHAVGVSREPDIYVLRGAGVALTIAVIGLAALTLIVRAF